MKAVALLFRVDVVIRSNSWPVWSYKMDMLNIWKVLMETFWG